jgi:hypothetical protein
VALGSCEEVRALLEAAVAFGVLSEAEQQSADALADRVCAMTYRLRQRWAEGKGDRPRTLFALTPA